MKRSKTNCDLQHCSLCKGCLKEWLPALDANRITYSFKKGEPLFHEDDLVTGIYFVYEGKVKVHKRWGDEKELIVRFAGPGDIVGHRGLGKETFYPVSATALENVSACFINLDFFLATLKVNHDYAFSLLMFYAQELQVSEQNMRNMAHMPVKGRVAYALLKLEEKFGLDDQGLLNISLTRQDLASYAGTTYETAFRILTELTQEKLIEFSGKDVQIKDAKALGLLLLSPI
ncbi:Crp/Fnr family transcriptional regulator [Segetibacter sp. 3557_3]|uniref:Crp/Fnr family transcriptional regulator n=1 Tax=Segetibacter sp. 3557_3 TaxID=2547429 RepID=UPI0010586125|nr:Crp/Fnr family transcriptional regulator [Segetibacter sp. 3557_3]TDH27329.1 Crp/Fnr family transcriptional regulator [Segetibacter sp. 3557_3]